MSIHQFIVQYGAGALGGDAVDAPESVETEEMEVFWEHME
jgi:hypothetical protein